MIVKATFKIWVPDLMWHKRVGESVQEHRNLKIVWLKVAGCCKLAVRPWNATFLSLSQEKGPRMPAFLILLIKKGSRECENTQNRSQQEGGFVAWVMIVLGAQYTIALVLCSPSLLEPFHLWVLRSQGASVAAAYGRILITHVLLEQRRCP